jgi:hypothetical protein
VEVGESTIQVKYTLVRGEKSNEIVSVYFGGLRAYVESCLGQMQVGVNRSKVSFQGIADLVSIKGHS